MSAFEPTRGGHTLAIRAVSRTNSDINVTPLVDVVLVLLIIFMVVTPLLEKEIGVQIPETEKAEAPDDVPPNQVLVRIDATGALAVNGAPIAGDALTETLRARLSGHGRKVVFVSADDQAPYPGLVSVLDSARRAGADTLGMTSGGDPVR